MSAHRKAIKNWRLMIVVLLVTATVPAWGVPGQYRGPDGTRYWYYDGQWLRWSGGKWVGTRAPVGLFLPTLPYPPTVISWNGIPYYYLIGTYYIWSDAKRQFQVVAPPAGISSGGATRSMPPATEDRLFVYPKNGQSPEQQRKDRAECAGAAVPVAQAASCLNARGYSTR
jgi:hypothetical protein